MAGELVLIDSNVLIRWVQPEGVDFQIVTGSIRSIDKLRDVPCFTSQNLGEFWNVLTRPANRNGYGLPPEEAHVRAEKVESKFRLLQESLEVHSTWRKILVDYRVSGVQVHDARLVAATHVHGVKRILTFNTKDFERYDQIEAIHPAEMALKG
jgi:predicted nucleic acid-binding protein